MLILTRKAGESITINGTIRVTVLAIRGQQARLGVEAPAEVPIFRQELLQKKNPFLQESRASSRIAPLRRKKSAG